MWTIAPLLSTLILATTGEALAAESTVLVAPFTPLNREAAGLAALLPGFLGQELDAHPGLSDIPMAQVPPVHQMPARVYAETCPPAEFVGCGFVLGETSGADYAITGTVESLVSGTRVEIHIIDVGDARDVLSFQAELGTGDDEVFAQGVARVLVAVVRGEAGADDDIRDEAPEAEDPGDALIISRQLDQLSREIGDVTTMSRRTEVEIERPRVTAADIAEDLENEGAKPWERLDMSATEYLHYRNSGMTLVEWRDRRAGRGGQLIVRGAAGLGSGAHDMHYYGRYAEDDTLTIVETYAWQSIVQGRGLLAEFAVGYGLTAQAEVGLTLGMARGRFEIDPDKVTVGSNFQEQQSQEDSNTATTFGFYTMTTLLPTKDIRPTIGGQVRFLRSTAVADHITLPSELPGFTTAPTLLQGGLTVGGELRITRHVDMYAHIPINVSLGGASSEFFQSGSGGLSAPTPVPDTPAISGGMLVGLQAKFLGGRPAESLEFDDY